MGARGQRDEGKRPGVRAQEAGTGGGGGSDGLTATEELPPPCPSEIQS